MYGKLRNRGRLTVMLLSAVILVGCAGLPTAPGDLFVPGDLVSDPQWARTTEPGGADLSQQATSSLTREISKPVEGNVGGIVSTGRFSVEVPSGAFEGTGEISISIPDTNVLRVELHIKDVPNDFQEPVRLVVSWDGMLGSLDLDPNALEMAWFDEDRKTWVIIPSHVDLEARTIWSDLQHFSEYGVLEGKAGW